MTSQPKESCEKEKSDTLVDLHVYIVPLELWLEKYHKARNTAVLESVSAGFIRVPSTLCLHYIRDVITDQLGSELIPERFIFLRSVGRCLAVVNRSQELVMNASDFVHPVSQHSELFLLPNTNDTIDTSPKRIPDINFGKNSIRNSQEYENVSTTTASGRSDIIDENNYVHFSNMLPSAPAWNLLTPHRQSNDISDINTPNFSQFTDGSGSSNSDGALADVTPEVRMRSEKYDDDIEKTAPFRKVQLNENVDELQARILKRIEMENSRLESEESNRHSNIEQSNETGDVHSSGNVEDLVEETEQVEENYEFTNMNFGERNESLDKANVQESFSVQNMVINEAENTPINEQLLGDKGNPAILAELELSCMNAEVNSLSQEEVKKPSPVVTKKGPKKKLTSPSKSKLDSPKKSKIKVKDSYANNNKERKKSKPTVENSPPVKPNENEKENTIEKKSKSDEVEELKRRVELVRAERKTYDQSLKTYAKKREEIISEMKTREQNENNIYKKKYTLEKYRTVELEKQIEKIGKTIEKQFQKSIPIPTSSTNGGGTATNKDGGAVVGKRRNKLPPSEQSNQRNMVLRLQHEINDLNIRHEMINRQLMEETTMKTFAVQELRDLRLKNSKTKSILNTSGDDKSTNDTTLV